MKRNFLVFLFVQEFWFFPPDRVNGEQLETLGTLKDALLSSEPITAELDRNIQVLHPNQANQKFSLPSDFFSLNAEEIRKAQQAR